LPEATGPKILAKAQAQLTADIQAKLADANSYATMYQLIGQELYVAKRLLDSGNPEHGRMGLSIALQASRNALDYSANGWLAARICEGYIWPHLDLATDSNRRSNFSLESILNQCANIFAQNEEGHNVIQTYKILLAHAKTPLLADAARAQLGRVYQQNGEFKEALSYYKQIKATNDPNYRREMWQIQRLEKQVKGK
jgi:tetratricopeptide (TPR) repeat protein